MLFSGDTFSVDFSEVAISFGGGKVRGLLQLAQRFAWRKRFGIRGRIRRKRMQSDDSVVALDADFLTCYGLF